MIDIKYVYEPAKANITEIVEELDSTIAEAIDRLDTHVMYGEHLDDEAFETIQEYIDYLEQIRGIINGAEL